MFCTVVIQFVTFFLSLCLKNSDLLILTAQFGGKILYLGLLVSIWIS
jgi:hypothetical protein